MINKFNSKIVLSVFTDFAISKRRRKKRFIDEQKISKQAETIDKTGAQEMFRQIRSKRQAACDKPNSRRGQLLETMKGRRCGVCRRITNRNKSSKVEQGELEKDSKLGQQRLKRQTWKRPKKGTKLKIN